MKRIYMFTLLDYDGDKHTKSNLRLLAYLLYAELSEYEVDHKVLVKHKNMLENRIIEFAGEKETEYHFIFDDGDMNNCFVNPLLIGEDSFAITVYDDSISEEDIRFLLKNNMMMIKVNYNFSISSVMYNAKGEIDESKRIKAIKELTDSKLIYETGLKAKTKSKSKTKINFISPLLGLTGR